MDQFRVLCQRISRQSKYEVYFQYHKEVVERIKSLDKDKRKWDGVKKCWVLHTKALFELIKSYKNSTLIFFDFGGNEGKQDFIEQIKKIEKKEIETQKTLEELAKKKDLWVKLKEEYENNFKEHSDRVHKNLKDGIKLYPHQIVAALFLNETKSALLSLEMGLGKTASSIAYVEMNEMEKVLVITPNSLKFNYYGEVEKFTNSKAHIINWKKNEYSIEESKYVIVNYEFFNPSDKRKMDDKFKKLNIGKIDCVICDESHRLKNTKSNTYKNFKRIFTEKIFRDKKISKVFLSGTPAPNRAHELYTVLNQISPIDFATKTHFYEYYCGMRYDPYGFGWVTDNASQKLEELFYKIAPYTYRKRKEDVLDLPDKIYQRMILELSPKEENEYQEIENDTVNELFVTTNPNPLTTILNLRQFLSVTKVKYMKEIIDTALEGGEKIVIVDVFKDSLYELHRMYPEISALHTGDQTVDERGELVSKFQDPNSEIKIFLGSIQTCNYGLTLTAANKLFILTLPFSVGEFDQVSDRLHRIGQKNTVNIYPVCFRDTIDEYVFNAIEGKRKEIVKVIDNEDYESTVSDSVISEVIAKLKRNL